MSAAHFSLLMGKAEETKEAMRECEKVLDALDVVETMVRAGFYRVSGDLYKVRRYSLTSFRRAAD